MPEVRPLGFGPEGCGPLSHAQARVLVGAQKAPELRIVVARQGLEPAPEVARQHGYAADHSRVSRQAVDRHRHIVERRGTHEVLPESGPNPPGPDALLASTLRTQGDKEDGPQIAALSAPVAPDT